MVSAVPQRPQRQKWAIGLLVSQLLITCVAWLAAWFELETIVGTGPVLTIVGLSLALVVRPLDSWTPLLVALSAPVVCAVGAFVIAIFHLGPAEARAPILVLLTIYMCLVVPMAIVSYARIRQWPTHAVVGEAKAWRYSMKTLLGLMTGVALLTALLTSVVRSVYDFPLVFATFGSAVLILAGLVVWRFSIYRSRTR